MKRNPVVTSSQLMFMLVGSALVFPYTFMPILSAPPANQDVWISMLLAVVYIFLITAPLLFLINKFKGVNVNEMTEMILGSFFGKVAALIFALFFFYCFTACMLITAVFVNLYIFPETPIWALLVYMIVPVIYASYKGAGTIGRLATFIIPFIILTIIIFFALGLKLMDFRELQPVLAESTFLELNEGAFLTGARYSEILIFLVFSFWLTEKAKINKIYAVSLGIFSLCFLLILVPTVTVLGVEMAKQANNPYFLYTRQVSGYDFIDRVQSLNTLAWYPVALLKLVMYNFMCTYILAGVFKTKSHKGFVIPISAIGVFICMLPVLNKAVTVEFLRSDEFFPYIILPVTFIVPSILVIVYFIRRKRIKNALRQKNANAE